MRGFREGLLPKPRDKVKEVDASCGGEFVFHFFFRTVALNSKKSVSFQFERVAYLQLEFCWGDVTGDMKSPRTPFFCGEHSFLRWSSGAASANAS